MPLTVEDFEKTKEGYQYKQYEISVYKVVYGTNRWWCYITDTEKGERIYSGGEYANSRDTLNSAIEHIDELEYQPKFKRGDILINTYYPDQLIVITEFYNAEYEIRVSNRKESIFIKHIDKVSKKVGEITDMSVLEGE